MKSKILACIAVLSLLTGILIACQGGTEQVQTPSGTQQPGQTQTSAPAPIAAGEVIKWRCQTSMPAGIANWWIYATELRQKIIDGTGGRLEIEFLPAGAIVGANEVMDAVSSGAVETGYGCDGYWQGKDIRFAITGMISGHFTWDEMTVWFYNDEVGGYKQSAAVYEKYGVKNFYMGCGVMEAEYMAKKPIRTLGDYKGLKFRGMGWTGMIMNEPEFGASGVMIPPADVYTSLERGVIDACEYADPFSNYSSGLHEIAKFMGFPGVHQMTQANSFMINMDSWKSLPKDIQTVIELACAYSNQRNYAFSIYESVKVLPKMKAAGVEFIYEDPEVQRTWRDVSWRLADNLGKDKPEVKVLWDNMKKLMTEVRPYLTLQTPNYGD